MKTIIWMLIGAVTGFFVMYGALSIDFSYNFPSIAFETTITLIVITILLLLFAVFNMLQMKNKSKLVVTGEKEDELEVWQYKRFSDTTLCNTVALVFGIAASAVSIITNQPLWLMITSIVAAVVAMIFPTILSGFVHIIYPDRELPTVSDKNYAHKLLAASDEGERHVMLEGLYRAFGTVNAALILALLLLIIYSVGTGNSQLFAIFIVGIILIIANAQYLFTIRNKS